MAAARPGRDLCAIGDAYRPAYRGCLVASHQGLQLRLRVVRIVVLPSGELAGFTPAARR